MKRMLSWIYAGAPLAVFVAGQFQLSAAESVASQLNPEQSEVLSIGIAPRTWQGLNRNDATAAMSAWAKTILGQQHISISVQATLFESGEELTKALEDGQVDCATMLTEQFCSLNRSLRPEEVFIAVNNGSLRERYVVLVRDDSGIRSIADLQGRKLVVQTGARTSLAMTWLDSLLGEQGLGAPQTAFARLTEAEKPAKAVLPVFFRQADGCLITSNAFEVTGELNPQLRQQLRVLSVSPEVVPALFFFRRNLVSKLRQELEPAILSLHQTPSGRQVLTVFQSERMLKCPTSVLDSSYELVQRRDRTRRNNPLRQVSLNGARLSQHE